MFYGFTDTIMCLMTRIISFTKFNISYNYNNMPKTSSLLINLYFMFF